MKGIMKNRTIGRWDLADTAVATVLGTFGAGVGFTILGPVSYVAEKLTNTPALTCTLGVSALVTTAATAMLFKPLKSRLGMSSREALNTVLRLTVPAGLGSVAGALISQSFLG